jgi:membrane-associated protease RseP (regulator of RpoE activity)
VSTDIPEKNPLMNEFAATPEVSSAVLSDIPRYAQPGAASAPMSPARRIPLLNVTLFVVTFLTTTMAGAFMEGAEYSLAHPFASIIALAAGLPFSIPLMAILLAHEMGHYLVARRNRVEVTLPYFIPAPFPSLFFIGTFGAFIRMKSMPRSRRVMFDIGAAGPWAGIAIAIPVLMLGLMVSHPATTPSTGTDYYDFGNSLLFLGIARLVHVNPDTVAMGRIAFAGWIGFFVTTLNLLPASQLDGGHVIYALFGRRHRVISRTFVVACVLMVVIPYLLGMEFWGGWLFWAVLLFAFGLGHPVTADVDTPLDPMRRFAAWATIVLFIVTFMPVPVSLVPGSSPAQPAEKLYNVMETTPAPIVGGSGFGRDL